MNKRFRNKKPYSETGMAKRLRKSLKRQAFIKTIKLAAINGELK